MCKIYCKGDHQHITLSYKENKKDRDGVVGHLLFNQLMTFTVNIEIYKRKTPHIMNNHAHVHTLSTIIILVWTFLEFYMLRPFKILAKPDRNTFGIF